MSTRIVSTFDVTGWDESPYDEPADEPRLARAVVTKTYRGPLEAEGVAELLMCQTDPADLAAGAGYVGSERVTGRLDGRTGSFVLMHGARAGAGTAPHTFGFVVPGSGTGELAGLLGAAEIARAADGSHTLTLDYTLDPPEAPP